MIQKNLIALVIVLTAFTAYGQDEARLMRFPSTNGEQIVFTYAGDL
jgi:tricorn protease